MLCNKHICIRHDGMLTIIPDAVDIITNTYLQMANVKRSNQKFVNFTNVTEVSSPYGSKPANGDKS